jgi:gluconolactonase
MSNQTMNRALEFAGYDVRHTWGAGTHNGNQAASLFPEAMRWLWRDWPAPIRVGEPGNPVLKAILQPGEDWQVAADDCAYVTKIAANPQGQIFYAAQVDRKISEIVADGKPMQCGQPVADAAFAFGADGRVYVTRAEGGIQVMELHAHGQPKILGQGLHIGSLTVRNNGDIYVVTRTANLDNELWLIRANGEKVRLDKNLKGASGVALSPDGL